MAVGNAGGGYANLEASPNYIGDAIRYNIDNGFKIRAEKRLDAQNKADAEEKRAIREDKEIKDIALENKNFDITQSGVNGIDGKVLELVHKNQDQVNEYNKVLYNPLSTREAKIAAQMQKGRIFDNLKQLSEANTNFKTSLAGIQKGIQDGSLDMESAKEALDRAKTLMGGNYHFDQNNEGLGTIDFYETDKDGKKVTDEKGNPKIKSSQTYTEFMSSLNPDKASTYAKDEQASVKTYMPDKSVIGEGGRIISKAVVDTKKGSRDWERIGAFVDTYLDKENERKILGRKLGIDPNNIEELRDKLILNYMAGTKNETSNLPDTSQQSLNHQIREDNRKRVKENEEELKQKTNPVIVKGVYYLDKGSGDKTTNPENGIYIPTGSTVYTFSPTKKQVYRPGGVGGLTSLSRVYIPKGRNNLIMVVEDKFTDEDGNTLSAKPQKRILDSSLDGPEVEQQLRLNGYKGGVEEFKKDHKIKTIKPTTTKKVEDTKETEYKANTNKKSR